MEMMQAPDQAVRVGVSVKCSFRPPELREPVIRCAHELAHPSTA